MRKRQRSNT